VIASLGIGEFAKATHFSIKTLRHYHKVGLLVPAQVDAASGYRRYACDQVVVAQVIRRLRDLDMPLGEIATVVRTPDPGARAEMIAAHLTRLEGVLARTQAAVASLRDLLATPPATLAIEYRREPEVDTASIAATVELAELAIWFRGAIGELDATLAARGLAPAGPAGAIVADEFFTDESGEIIVYVPVASSVRPTGRVVARKLPAVELAVIVHPGSHVDIDRSYGELARFVAERAIGVGGPIRERYLVDRRSTPESARWRTEIGWPVFWTSPGGV
jgi:DNA-binding transcriptional MerR regulator